MNHQLFEQPAPSTRHYYLIDGARGLAAIAILFWHYQHFFTEGVAAPGSRGEYPLYSIFWLLYDGGVAVQLFWIISGFVFAAVYCARDVTGKVFFRSRFARLYPLHLLTLVTVTVLQAVSFYLLGEWLIYPYNDIYHFVLQIAFISGWGFEYGDSFNGPIWSVSIELIVYLLFWMLLPFVFRRGVLWPAVISLLSLAIWIPTEHRVALCAMNFFAGTALYVLSAHLRRRESAIMSAAIMALSVAIYVTLGLQGVATLLAFNSLVLAIVTVEGKTSNGIRPYAQWIGDSTYGIYLWHIPIQIIVLLAVRRELLNQEMFREIWFLLVFLATVIATARLSYVKFEAPWRRRLSKRGRVDAPIAGP